MRLRILAAAVSGVLMLASCGKAPEQSTTSNETADAFVARVNKELLELSKEISATQWAYATYINQDTE